MPGPPWQALADDGCTGGGRGGGQAGGGQAADTPGRAFSSAAVTLTLAILGSSVLPLPFAFSRLGVLPGLAVMMAVAVGNALAGTLLLRAAGCLDKHSYESLAEAVGGRSWRLITEVCLILLLFGNLCGDLCLLADMGRIAAQGLFPGGAPTWLIAGGGRLMMVALAVFVVFPLSCLRHMRELEKAATVGAAFVVVLAGVFIYYGVADGLPAIASRELPIFKPAVMVNLPEAVGVLSFAFYLTPMLLPLLREMPPGKVGVDLTCRAVQVVTVGVAYITYAIIGIFAAARYGLRTEGDVLVNEWLPGRWEGALSAGMTFYLSISMAPMVITLRAELQNLLIGEDAQPLRLKQVALTGGCVLAPLLVALPFPTAAEKMFAITGATAVCAVCYVLPILIHLRLYLRSSRHWHGGGSSRHCHGSSKAGLSTGWGSQGRLHRRHSFSFDHRAGSAEWQGLGAQAGEGGEGPDLRWLLSTDHHATAAALCGLAPATAGATAAAQHAQQQQQRRRHEGEAAGGAAADEEGGDGEEGGTAALRLGLGSHRFTDLSLNRWLRGQSYDSFGGYPDSLPATPVSPNSRQRDSLDSFRDTLMVGGAGSLDKLQGWGGSGGAEEGMPWGPGGWEEAQQWGVAPYGGAGMPGVEPGLGLEAVPETAAMVPGEAAGLSAAADADAGARGNGSRPSCAGMYPSAADAGSGRAAVLPLLQHVVLPLAVLILGVASSVSAFILAIAALH